MYFLYCFLFCFCSYRSSGMLCETSWSVFISLLEVRAFYPHSLLLVYSWVRKGWKKRNQGLPSLSLSFSLIIFSISGCLMQGSDIPVRKGTMGFLGCSCFSERPAFFSLVETKPTCNITVVSDVQHNDSVFEYIVKWSPRSVNHPSPYIITIFSCDGNF